MAARRKIPPNLEDDILRLRGEGKVESEIAAWLGTKGVDITTRGVGKFLERFDKKRAPLAQAIAEKELSGKVIADLQGFDGIIARAEKDERAAEMAISYADVEKTLTATATVKLGDYFHADGTMRPMAEWTEAQQLAAESVKIREVIQETEADDGAPMKKTATRVIAVKLRDSTKAGVELVAVRERKVARELALKARDQQARVREVRLEMAGAKPPPGSEKKRVVVLPPVRPVAEEPETQPITH